MIGKAIATFAAAVLTLGTLTACASESTRICVAKTEIRRVSDHNCDPNIDDKGGFYMAVYIAQGHPVPNVGEQVKGEYHTSKPE